MKSIRPTACAARPRAARALAQRLMLLAVWLLAWAGWMAPALAQTAVQAVPPGAAPTDSFRISRGDELDLRFFYTPELNTKALVRSDGRISLHLVGEILVEGQTIAELGATIERLLAPQVKRAQVSINVSSPVTQRVFVGGEVVRPGVQPLAGPMTALQAVMVAEGIKDTGEPSMAVVLRRLPNGERQALPVDLHRLMKGQETGGDVVLQAFDVVLVPRAGIADVGRWVDLYIRRVLPISFGVSYTVDRNGGVAR
ncbi:MAG: polysaccharide biosynthesis/export family protein [Rubrivivax sp.]|jgi:polysaccharide export outer membrane protein